MGLVRDRMVERVGRGCIYICCGNLVACGFWCLLLGVLDVACGKSEITLQSIIRFTWTTRLLGTSVDVLAPVNPSIYKMDSKPSLSQIS